MAAEMGASESGLRGLVLESNMNMVSKTIEGF